MTQMPPVEMPSAEHRRHIRLFQRSTLTDEQDVAIRGFVAWKRWNHKLMEQQLGADRLTGKPKRR